MPFDEILSNDLDIYLSPHDDDDEYIKFPKNV